ncbi:hypothetical protein [Leptospira santarosai]|uniref:hypothetical protein n=1 Tax=Leptospira santarosai TaxID=28183 RepID=UPI0024AEFA31|nr:hypothetical protein [Leptospira santarosai]MDI7165945.1 hypothetical protein [Leptospira santarosai]
MSIKNNSTLKETKGNQMNVYEVFINKEIAGGCSEDKNSEIVFAKTQLRAKRLYYKLHGVSNWHYDDNEDMVDLKQIPPEQSKQLFDIIGECDLTTRGGIYFNHYKEIAPVLRELGWSYLGEDACDSCELYPFGIEEHLTNEHGLCNACAEREASNAQN